MRPFAQVVGHVLGDGPAEVAFPEGHQAIQTFLLDGADEALRVRVRIRGPERRLDDLHPGLLQVRPHRQAPLRIAVADQDAVVGQRPVVREDQRAGHLLHEHGIRVRRGPENPHASAGEIDDEERVIGDQARGRPHLGREEVRARNGAPMGPQEGLPGRRPLGHRREAVPLENPGDRRAAHPMADNLQRPLNARIPPRRILLGHANDQRLNRTQHPGAPSGPPRVAPRVSHQPPVPSQNRGGGDKAGHALQAGATQTGTQDGQSATLVIGQTERPAAELGPERPVLLEEVVQSGRLAPVEPGGQGEVEPAERRRITHAVEK